MRYPFVSVVLFFVLLLAGNLAQASATNWALMLKASYLDDTQYGTAWIGVVPTALDGVDESDGPLLDMDLGASVNWPSPVIDGNCYGLSLMSTASYSTYPGQQKKWAFRVGAAPGISGSIKLQFGTRTIANDVPQPPSDPSIWKYYVRLVDDRGRTINKPGWAGGGVWGEGEKLELTVPATTVTYFGAIEMPALTLTGYDSLTMYNEGYAFEFIQGAIPEPGSFLGLGAGLFSLSGLVLRRRRA